MKRILRLGNERGQAIVEFTLVLPILLMLVLGMVEFGRAWHIQQVLADAAREGARRAAIHSDPPATQQDIVDAIGLRLANAGIDPAEVETIDLTGWDAGRNEPVTVFIEVPHQFNPVSVMALDGERLRPFVNDAAPAPKNAPA